MSGLFLVSVGLACQPCVWCSVCVGVPIAESKGSRPTRVLFQLSGVKLPPSPALEGMCHPDWKNSLDRWVLKLQESKSDLPEGSEVEEGTHMFTEFFWSSLG